MAEGTDDYKWTCSQAKVIKRASGRRVGRTRVLDLPSL
jgi:hypothetical protein